jgi:hypothetical protein
MRLVVRYANETVSLKQEKYFSSLPNSMQAHILGMWGGGWTKHHSPYSSHLPALLCGMIRSKQVGDAGSTVCGVSMPTCRGSCVLIISVTEERER